MGIKTTAQIAREDGVHPLLVGQWKLLIRERLPQLFERGHAVPDDSERVIAGLHQKIGQRPSIGIGLKKSPNSWGCP